MELWTALLIGLAGSLHCIGMCGPIAIALPAEKRSGLTLLIGRLLYNLGRMITYGLLGYFFGYIGKAFFIGGYQQILSIVLGCLILLAVLIPGKYVSKFSGGGWQARMIGRMKSIWQRLFKLNSSAALFGIGILNGFLPCGLVYIALAGSVATHSPVKGMFYMITFGLGTVPVMLAISLAGKMLGTSLKLKLRRLIPIGGVLLALLFIMRGLSLGIPYLSPIIEKTAEGEVTVNCCHQADSSKTEFIESSGDK